MKRVLPFFLLLACSGPALGQPVDSQGAIQLSDSLKHYFGRTPFDIGFVKISVDGDSYRLAFDFKPVADLLAKQQALRFDLTPYFMLAKPRDDGRWDVSAETPLKGSFDFAGPQGPQHIDFSISNNKFAGVYDPDLAAFASAMGSLDAMTMNTREAQQQADVSAGAGIATMTSTKSANGGVDFTLAEKVLSLAEVIKVNDPKSGLTFAASASSPELSVDATGKGVKTKSLLDLLAFAVANESDVKLKANQAEFKSLLLAALPVWERVHGTYGFKDLAVESPVGRFGAAQLKVAGGIDGISQHGKIDYAIKASGLTIPQQILPGWSVALLPTDVELNFGGANIDLDSMARKTIQTFDLNKNPPLPEDFGAQIAVDFLARMPKAVIGRSTLKNKDIEIAMEGEVTYPAGKPDVSMTVDIAGYDKIVATLQTAAKTDPDAAQYFPAVLAVKGFGTTLPDGRLEWVVKARPDGSVLVNGAMLKAADPVENESLDLQDDGADENDGGAAGELNP